MNLTVLSGVRTNNFNDAQVGEKIGQAWGEAMSNPEFHGKDVYGVYHNYEGNYAGDYDLSICVEGTSAEGDSLEISGDTNYQVFKVEPVENGVFNKWSEIWELEGLGKINRDYSLDYELHKADGTKEIHIAVK